MHREDHKQWSYHVFLFLAGNKPPWFTDEMPKNISIISADPGGFSLNLTKYVKDDQDSPSKMSFSVDTNINTTDYSLSKLDAFKKLKIFICVFCICVHIPFR